MNAECIVPTVRYCFTKDHTESFREFYNLGGEATSQTDSFFEDMLSLEISTESDEQESSDELI